MKLCYVATPSFMPLVNHQATKKERGDRGIDIHRQVRTKATKKHETITKSELTTLGRGVSCIDQTKQLSGADGVRQKRLTRK